MIWYSVHIVRIHLNTLYFVKRTEDIFLVFPELKPAVPSFWASRMRTARIYDLRSAPFEATGFWALDGYYVRSVAYILKH